MKKTLSLLVALCLLCLPALASASPDDHPAPIQAFMRLYGYPLSEDLQADISQAFTPVTLSVGDVEITLAQLLYDGVWVVTAAYAVPTDPEAVLLFPSSASSDDSVAGNNRENQREDTRGFFEAAKEDGKRLVCVRVDLKEYDAVPVSFLEHLQWAQEVSVLFSGAEIGNGEERLPLTWSIRVFEYDLSTGEILQDTLREETVQATSRS